MLDFDNHEKIQPKPIRIERKIIHGQMVDVKIYPFSYISHDDERLPVYVNDVFETIYE